MQCDIHNIKYKQFCINPDCNSQLSGICQQCSNNHEHVESVTLKRQIVERYIKLDSEKQKQNSRIKQNLEIISKVQANLKIMVNKSINKIFNRININSQLGDKFLNNYDVESLRKLDQRYRDTYNKENEQVKYTKYEWHSEILEFKTMLKEVLQKFFDWAHYSNTLISDPDNHEDERFIQQTLKFKQRMKSLINTLSIQKPVLQRQQRQSLAEIEQKIKSKMQNVDPRTKIQNLNQLIKLCAQALRINPIHESMYFNKAKFHYEIGQYKQSFITYSICLDLKSNLHIAYINRGLCLNNLRLYKQAIQNFQQALRLYNNYPNAFAYKGISYLKLERLEQALACQNRQLQINKDHQQAKIEQTKILTLIKNRRK